MNYIFLTSVVVCYIRYTTKLYKFQIYYSNFSSLKE